MRAIRPNAAAAKEGPTMSTKRSAIPTPSIRWAPDPIDAVRQKAKKSHRMPMKTQTMANCSRRNAMSTGAQLACGRRGSSSSSSRRRGRERGRSSSTGVGAAVDRVAAPMVIGAEHPGQRVFLPANSARTRNFFSQRVQVTSRVFMATSQTRPATSAWESEAAGRGRPLRLMESYGQSRRRLTSPRTGTCG